MPSTTSFRFSSRSVFLTYSQVPCSFTKETVLYDIDARYPVKDYCIGEEQHEDGGRHIHAYLVFIRKVDSRDVSLFDISCFNDEGEVEGYHPNMQPVKRGKAHQQRLIDYVTKEDTEPLTNINEPMAWGEMIAAAKSADDFMSLVRENYPRDYCLSYDRIKSMADKEWKKGSIHTLSEFTPSYTYPINVELACTIPDYRKSLVVVGPAGCGKTTWAKQIAPKPALFVRHLDTLKEFDGHASIIFDDLCFKHLPPATQKFVVDMENTADIHIRYTVATIPASVWRVFTCNEYCFLEDGPHAEAINRRVNKLYL